MDDHVTLVFPASSEYLRLARLLAAALGAQLNFTLDDIEDLRIAVDELCSALVEAADGSGNEVTVVFRLAGHELHMEAEVSTADGDAYELDEISAHILRASVDKHELEHGNRRLIVRMTKRCLVES